MPQPYMASSIPEEELSKLYRLMTEEIGDVAVFFMNSDGIITTWNRAAEEMKGYTADDAIGQHLELLYTLEQREQHWPQHNLEEAASAGYYKEETWRRKKDGSLFWARICLTALKDSAGTVLGFSKITLDLTDHKLLESCVKEREQVRRVLRAANAGTWKWNPQKAEVSVCENFLRLLGHASPDTTLPFATWLEYFYESDRAAVVAGLEAAREAVPFDMEFRLRLKDGHYRWFFSRAEWYRELDEQPWELNGVNVEIQNFKVAQEEVRLAMQKLEDADRRKDEFLAMLAHELRNPLAPIRAAAEVMRYSSSDEDRQLTSEVIARQSDHLTSLVDDLLDVSRVTRGLVRIQKEPQDFRHILSDAVEQATPAIQARKHHLTVNQSEQSAVVLGDRKRLVQVVSNLLNNAAKYTPPGGHIEVSTHLGDRSLSVVVNDDGAGMDAETVEHAFELFSQAKRTPDRTGGGLGLGLALVKNMVELHGGEVSCASAGLGKGSTFTIRLPLGTGKGQQDGAAEMAQRRHHRSLRVMIVDDNTDAARMQALLIRRLGHTVVSYATPYEALEHAVQEPAEVYLLDIGLPEIDGYELARRLRRQPSSRDAVFVAVTGYGQETDRAEALRAGFAHHLVKPVDPRRLESVLDTYAALAPT